MTAGVAMEGTAAVSSCMTDVTSVCADDAMMATAAAAPVSASVLLRP
jgi:hypothetical protein